MLLTQKLEQYKRHALVMKTNSERFIKLLDYLIEYKATCDHIPENEKELIKAIFDIMDRFYGLNQRRG